MKIFASLLASSLLCASLDAAAIDDKKAAARAAGIYHRVAEEMAAQEAALDHLQERGRGKS